MKKAYPHEEYVDTVRPQGPRFMIETVKVIREHKEHFVGPSGATIGQLIDDAIMEAINSGQELLDVCLHFEREDWIQMARNASEGKW